MAQFQELSDAAGDSVGGLRARFFTKIRQTHGFSVQSLRLCGVDTAKVLRHMKSQQVDLYRRPGLNRRPSWSRLLSDLSRHRNMAQQFINNHLAVDSFTLGLKT